MTNHLQNISTILIIDDNELDHILYKRIIKRSNRVDNVISFSYADEALEFLKREDRVNIDVIFLDINMPRMNGFEFLAAATDQLGDSFADAVIVMLTTSLATQDKERANQFDVVKAFLNKPLTVGDIDFIADEIIHGWKEKLLIDQPLKTQSQ